MKVNILNRVAVAFVISGVLLMGTSVPANAQENQDKQQRKQQRKAEQQQQKTNISFGTETQLTTGGTSLYYGFASSGNNVYIVRGPGDGDVNFRRSTDQGSTWSGDTLIGTAASPYLQNPLIADGNNVFVFYVKNTAEVTDWCCPRNAGEVFVAGSTDSGATWSAEVRISAVNARAYRVGASIAGSNVHIVWCDFRNSNWDLFYQRSTDTGATWLTETQRVVASTPPALGAERPSIFNVGNDVYLSWMDARDTGCTGSAPDCSEIFFEKSTDNGVTWTAHTQLTTDVNRYSGRPSITVSGSVALIAYEQTNAASTSNDIFMLRSTDGGANWVNTRMSFKPDGTNSTHGPVLITGSVAHIAWHTQEGGGTDIHYRFSNTSGATWSTPQQVSSASGLNSIVPMLVQTPTYVHVLWSDGELWYRRGTLP